MRERLYASLIEVKSFNDETGEFEGYASTFGNVDGGNDVCVKGCFTDTIAEMFKTDSMPGMFWQHDKKEPIGEWLQMKEDAKGLWVKGKLWVNKGIARADQAYAMLKSKGPKGLSIGFIAEKVRKTANGVREILKTALAEVSVVTFPMNDRCRIVSVKSDNTDSLVDENQIENNTELKQALLNNVNQVQLATAAEIIRRNIATLSAN